MIWTLRSGRDQLYRKVCVLHQIWSCPNQGSLHNIQRINILIIKFLFCFWLGCLYYLNICTVACHFIFWDHMSLQLTGSTNTGNCSSFITLCTESSAFCWKKGRKIQQYPVNIRSHDTAVILQRGMSGSITRYWAKHACIKLSLFS